MLERPQTQKKISKTQDAVENLQDKETDYENEINIASEKYDFILDAEEYNELLHKREEVKKLTEELKKAGQNIIELKRQLATATKQNETEDFKEQLIKELKTYKEAMRATENEIISIKNTFQQQKALLQKDLCKTQQKLSETCYLLKQREAEIDDARLEIVALNESFMQEQSAHKDTCDQLKEITRIWSLRFDQQAQQHDAKLLEYQTEINKLRNALKGGNYKSYSSVVKNSLYKENKSTSHEKDNIPGNFVYKL